MDKSHRVFAQFVQLGPSICSEQQALCDHSHSLQPRASRVKTHIHLVFSLDTSQTPWLLWTPDEHCDTTDTCLFSSRSPSPAPVVNQGLCSSPRQETRPPSAPPPQSPVHGPPHGPDVTAEDRIASYLRHPSSSSRPPSSTPQPSTLSVLADPTENDRTPSPPPPSETDDDATITEPPSIRDGRYVRARPVVLHARHPSPSPGAAAFSVFSAPSNSQRLTGLPVEESFAAARQHMSSSPLSDAHGSVPVTEDGITSPYLGWVPELVSTATPHPVDHASGVTDSATTQEHLSPPLPSTAYFASQESGSTSSRQSVTPSLLSAMNGESKIPEAAPNREPVIPSLSPARGHILEVADSVSSQEPVSASSPGVQQCATETPGTSPFEGPPKDAQEDRPSTPLSSDSNNGYRIVIELGSKYNSPESPQVLNRNVSPSRDSSASPNPSRKRKATEATDEEDSKPKRTKATRTSKTTTTSTPTTTAKRVATRRSTRTPATVAASHNPGVIQDAARTSPRKPKRERSRKPPKTAPPESPSHRATKPSQGKAGADGPYGLRSRETRKVTAKVAMNMELDS